MRGQCHKAKGNRRIEVNHRLNELKAKARERLTSETGLYHRSKRPIEVEAVFGQMKSNNRFNRFSMRGLEKIDIEFALMCIGHNLRKWGNKRQKDETEKTKKTLIARDGQLKTLLELYVPNKASNQPMAA
ncbi:transposase, partial [Parapedobacter sp. SGR-10]|uniref:transposase n=1 Tax=Parapedobacter sp. SGR-10 TaxID=2710879 RepID=UPI001981B4CF